MKKTVWKVTGFNVKDGMENLFEAYFTDRDVAHTAYHKGEREYGVAAGYVDMRWTLEGFYIDDTTHIDQMFEDVREAMEELEMKKTTSDEGLTERLTMLWKRAKSGLCIGLSTST